ncbi:MAG: hypothetical protein DI586_10130 [Micavibrio aeruginosavorus]|uniref:ABC transporter permease n=1 Tax=Micavibrio aeruginosavorus TaxID=349221 RepID=A0A2W5FH21_9BACT|nr:MAG: hypothetical protein DI586_10130 [Micavibrio aeruginosavorus]
MSGILVKYVLTAARRDKLFLSLLAIMIVGSFVSLFLSSSAVVEKEQFSVVYLAGSLRLLGLLGLVLFVVFFIRRSFDARDVEYLLTRPVTRNSFVLSHAAAFSILSAFVSISLCAGLGFIAYNIGNPQGVIYWSTGVICEYLLIVNVALFFSMVLSSPVAACLSTLGFYILGRLMGQLLFVAKNPSDGIPGYQILTTIFQAISALFPRLDLMTQTSWLLYGVDGIKDYIFILVQTALFLALVLIATLVDLRRRQF